MQGSILVVEHDAAMRELLAGNLRSAGYQVTRARDFLEAEGLMHKIRPDMALLGCPPGAPGLLFARQLRADRRTAHTSIIMLSARPGEESTVAALECGADDCLARSVSIRELLARIKAVLRRRAPERTEETIEFAGLRVDPALQRVTSGEREIDLPRTDFRLLLYFVTHPGWILTRRKLLDEIWGDDVYVEERTVDVHVRRLRRALPEAQGELIETVRGMGYRWRTGPEPVPAPALHSAVSSLAARMQELPEMPLPALAAAAVARQAGAA
ncbi:MAG TPA: winged helix-turn-helix domain-containing protein [Steroidobacteraceae bacterium]|nr:winged helix-turn-helix domain-containing protein [Steroidobacteraceae bacterium]